MVTISFNTQATPVEESNTEIYKRIRAKWEKKEKKMEAAAIAQLLNEGKVRKITDFLPSAGTKEDGMEDDWTNSILARQRTKKFCLKEGGNKVGESTKAGPSTRAAPKHVVGEMFGKKGDGQMLKASRKNKPVLKKLSKKKNISNKAF